MSPEQFVKTMTDLVTILENAVAGNYFGEIPAALQLGKDLLVALPPLDAKDLSPEDRAAADKEAADLEAAKFGK